MTAAVRPPQAYLLANMESITLAEALEKYEPVILKVCQHLWACCDDRQYIPCELPDLIQAARLRIAEKWALFNHRGSVAPYMRKVARSAAISHLRDLNRNSPLPIDLQQFAHLAG